MSARSATEEWLNKTYGHELPHNCKIRIVNSSISFYRIYIARRKMRFGLVFWPTVTEGRVVNKSRSEDQIRRTKDEINKYLARL